MKHISLAKKTPFEFGRKELNLIAALRGLPEDRGHSRSRPVKGVETLIDKLIKKNGWGAPESPQLTLMKHWKQILGEHMAQRASPQSIMAGGKLVVSVSNPIIREELRFQQRQILQKIEAVLGRGVVRDLLFRV